MKRIKARFFETDLGNAPVREWLLSLSAEDRRVIGFEIKTAEFGWPVGMPLCRSITGFSGLWELRVGISDGRIARILFVVHNGDMVLLNGFIKKSQKSPQQEIDLALRRARGLRR